jgi:hypothetical protein
MLEAAEEEDILLVQYLLVLVELAVVGQEVLDLLVQL